MLSCFRQLIDTGSSVLNNEFESNMEGRIILAFANEVALYKLNRQQQFL